MINNDASPSLVQLDRRKLLLGGLLAACAGLTFARQPRERLDYLGSGKLDKLIPQRIGDWEFLTTSGLVVPAEDPLSNALYSQLLTRVYTNESDPAIMLLIAQSAGQSGLLQVHRPEFCYPAGGYKLSPIVSRTVGSGGSHFAVNQLTASIPGRTEQILYWTRVGDSMPSSWAGQRLAIAEDNLRGVIPDAVLVRVSTIDLDGPRAFARLSDFVQQMIGAVPTAGQKILVRLA